MADLLETSGGDVEDEGELESPHSQGQTVDIPVDGNSGLLQKHVMHAGVGTAKPKIRDEVTVHFTSKRSESGEVLNSTQEAEGGSGRPAVFSIGTREQPRALEEAVRSMRKGEQALLTCDGSIASCDSEVKIDVSLLSWRPVKDINGDGGVIMKVVEDGEGFDKPRGMDVVSLYVSAKSLSSGKSFGKSQLGKMSVVLSDIKCAGLKTCVESMHKNEVVDAVIRRIGAQSEDGKSIDYVDQLADETPQDETEVALHIRLQSWEKVDYVEGTDSKVVKRIVKEGSGFERPNDGSKVTVSLTMRLSESQTTVYVEEELKFTVDEDEVISGLDRAVTAMRKGERAVLTVQPEYAFGNEHVTLSNGSEIPRNIAIEVDVELHYFEKEPESYLLSDEEKAQKAQQKKEDGNTLLKNGKVAKARKRYSQATTKIDAGKFEGELRNQTRKLKLLCCLNDAHAALQLGQPGDALSACNSALEIESANLKGLYRRAQAQYQLGDLDEADIDLKSLLEYDPRNADAINERRRIRREYKANTGGANYSNMFSSKARLYENEPTSSQQQSEGHSQADNDVDELSDDESDEENEREEER